DPALGDGASAAEVASVCADALAPTAGGSEFLRRCALDVYARIPLLAGERVIGTLGFGRRRRELFSDDELRFLRALGGYVTVARERIRTERRLVEQAERLRQADRRKDEFLAILAHELRNPL